MRRRVSRALETTSSFARYGFCLFHSIRSAYVPSRSDAPYPDTAHHATCFEPMATMGMHQSEAQSKFQWPQWTDRVKTQYPVKELVIE